ncbi:MAG: hypothetical protein JST00_12460 [Deltaproteobacteria bacterium]|nr:hypothetical protein [Deltaproteobacteria bacterium]
MSSSQPPSETLLVFSDVHLGSDIDERQGNAPRRSTAVDKDLVDLIAYYRRKAPGADRWRIVIAGDFIDFIGMTVAPSEGEALATPLTEEEAQHGIGGAADHARMKLRRVASRHADVFAELAAFVAAGHALSIVHGNHDIEFHWDEVKSDFRAILLAHAKGLDASLDHDAARDAFHARIEFDPWFFWRDGIAYIEHGHQYDPFCATANVMMPLSAFDPRRIARGFCDVLIRYVVRPTRGMKEHGHENVGLAYYVAFGARLGIRGMAKLGLRFARAVLELFRLRRAYVSEAAHVLRAEHEQRVAQLAMAKRIGIDRLRALLGLQVPPITSSIRGILASVLLDRLALALLASMALAGIAIATAFQGHAVWGAFGVLVAWSLLHRHLSKQRTVDPAAQMVERASHLAKLFPAAFVVMGHTHVPTSVRAGAATYINVGSWAEEEPAAGEEPASAGAYRAARTHLVIRVEGERPEAQFCTWASSSDGGDTGPRRFDV